MSIFNQFPWTNFREYNLDWVIKTVKECKATVDSALADVSNAVALYFTDHIDTTLTQSGDAADAATVGGRLTTVNNSISNHGGRILTLEDNMVHVYRFSTNGTVLSANAGVDVSDIIANWEDHDPFMILVDDFEAYNVYIVPVSGYNDRWSIHGVSYLGPFTFYTYTSTGAVDTSTHLATHVRIKGTSGSYSYGSGDYDAAERILQAMISGSSNNWTEMGNIIYQQSAAYEAYMLESFKIVGTTLNVTFSDGTAVALNLDGTIS